MSKTGLLGQSKPAANTNTLLYSAPIDKSASAVLTVANDGTGSAYSVGIKNWDQVLTVGASNYLLHPGDLFSSYQLTMGTSMALLQVLLKVQLILLKMEKSLLDLNRLLFLLLQLYL